MAEQPDPNVTEPEGETPPAASGDGSAEADALVSKLAATEARRRDLQSDRDRLLEENRRMSDAAANAMTPEQVAALVADGIRRGGELSRAHTRLTEQFPLAAEVDPADYTDAAALQAAMQQVHETRSAASTAESERIEATIRAQYEERFGALPAAPAGGNVNGTPPVTAEALLQTSMSDWMSRDPKDLLAAVRQLPQ